MAKATKKSSKSSRKKTKEEVRKVAPEVPPGLITLALSREDMASWANLMTICAKTFEELALTAAQNNDDASLTVLSARSKLSAIFADRLIDACRMPEPSSRDFH